MQPEIDLNDYQYDLPQEKIAFTPSINRSDSKLLVYKNNKISDTLFYNIPSVLPQNCLLIFNETKVVQARIRFHKRTGGHIEIFCLSPIDRHTEIHQALQAHSPITWSCMVGGIKKWKDKSEVLSITNHLGEELNAQFIREDKDLYHITFSWSNTDKIFAEILSDFGNIPLPPYIQRQVARSDSKRYQTVFAKQEGSVAAPTASLHFTKALIDEIKSSGRKVLYTTLHVGAGTFMPVKSDKVANHIMHSEWMEICIDSLKNIINQIENHQKIVAVGTTICRNIESLYWLGVKLKNNIEISWDDIGLKQWECYSLDNSIPVIESLQMLRQYMQSHNLTKLYTQTQLLILPGYTFKVTDVLITNFHQPGSTLLLLVAAFCGSHYTDIYNHALNHNYRFLSYGDSSILFRTT